MQFMRWWYEQNGQTNGPVDDGELRDLVEQGTLDQTSQVIQEGASEWTTVAQEASSIGLSSGAGGSPAAAPTSGYVPRYTSAPMTEPVQTSAPPQGQYGTPAQPPYGAPTPDAASTPSTGEAADNGGASIFSGKFWVDLAERVVRTFLQTFLGALFVGGVLDVSIPTVKAAAIAGIAAVLAVVMGLLSGPIGRKGSASTVV